MIKIFQLITHLPLIALGFPANTDMFFSMIIQISNFQLISAEPYMEEAFNYNGFNDRAYNNRFNMLGYQSLNFIVNLDILFVSMVFGIGMIVVGYFLRLT